MTPYMEMKLMAEAGERSRLDLQSKLDRVTTERDAARADLKTQTLRADAAVGDANEAEQRLAAADERADVLEGLLMQASEELHDFITCGLLDRIDAEIKRTERVVDEKI